MSDRKGHGRPKAIFGPVPLRAVRDRDLSTLHWRLLTLVASIHRFGDDGCYSTQRTLASMIGTHYSCVSKGLAALIGLGYISSEPNPRNRKQAVLKIIYTAEDKAVVDHRANNDVAASSNTMLGNRTTPVDSGANTVLPNNTKVVGAGPSQALGSAEQSPAKERENIALMAGGLARFGADERPARRPASQIWKDSDTVTRLERLAGTGDLDAEAIAELRRIVADREPDAPLRRRAEALLGERAA